MPTDFYPLSDSRQGIDFAIDGTERREGGTRGAAYVSVMYADEVPFKDLMSIKNSKREELMPEEEPNDDLSYSSCSLM